MDSPETVVRVRLNAGGRREFQDPGGAAAGILAGAIAWRRRNILLTVASGMLALHLFGYLQA